jgi:lipoprotein signal peptidase
VRDPSTIRQRPAQRRAVIVGLVVLLLDQVTKAAVDDWDCGDVICPFRNDELMLGIVGGTSLQVLLASVLGFVLFALWVRAVSRHARMPATAIALVVSGIVGNLIDRIWLGHVRDFIVGPAGSVFNIADVALVMGLAWAIGAILLRRRTAER